MAGRTGAGGKGRSGGSARGAGKAGRAAAAGTAGGGRRAAARAPAAGGTGPRAGAITAEHARLEAARKGREAWKAWGPYLSERQWGTVREDTSDNGDAWNSFPHDHARSRAYRWGEDGIAGYCDDQQRLCLSMAFWNGRDPILKERLFGLANAEGNHGEDVKELYFYLDSTPTHSWMRLAYVYPQRAYPYDELVRGNASRSRHERELELLDTGVLDGDRFFDVDVEFAKAAPDDVYVRVTARNRGPETATLHVLPQLWFRNDWWMNPSAPRPRLRAGPEGPGWRSIDARHPELGEMRLTLEGAPELLFTENETNTQRLWGRANEVPFVKDGINDAVVHGRADAVNPAREGTKSAARWVVEVPAGGSATLRMRLAPVGGKAGPPRECDAVMTSRLREADDFYRSTIPASLAPERANVMRQALAGMLWSKQYYFYDLDRWLDERRANPVSGGRHRSRNREWFHMLNRHVISMPDKWEYPWYAAWDLAFHALALHQVDPDFAKEQLLLMLHEHYMHPNGQIPAYEWNFGDVNPPVHAWATYLIYMLDRRRGVKDEEFLRTSFDRLALNFNWWINRKDAEGRNLFSGGFLGLDNIGVFDRSAPIPGGGMLYQADGTAWMAFFSHCMLQMALELAVDDEGYHSAVAKYLEHFLWIAGSMHRPGDQADNLWDQEDGFFYDVLVRPDGSAERLKVRSLVGLLSLGASTVFPGGVLQLMPKVVERIAIFRDRHPELMSNLHRMSVPGANDSRLLSILSEEKLRRVLESMLDEERFLGPYGIRSLSREHKEHPYVFRAGGEEFRVSYQPAESESGTFGGNSNWRGPVWFPMNVLLLRGLVNLHAYYGDSFTVEFPTRSGRRANLHQVAMELASRLEATFLPGPDGGRPVHGGCERFRTDPVWRDRVLFYEYFNGDTGEGLGASHQTGWTGLVAFVVDLMSWVSPGTILAMRTRPKASGAAGQTRRG